MAVKVLFVALEYQNDEHKRLFSPIMSVLLIHHQFVHHMGLRQSEMKFLIDDHVDEFNQLLPSPPGGKKLAKRIKGGYHVLKNIQKMFRNSCRGDILVFYYCGHGGYSPNGMFMDLGLGNDGLRQSISADQFEQAYTWDGWFPDLGFTCTFFAYALGWAIEMFHGSSILHFAYMIDSKLSEVAYRWSTLGIFEQHPGLFCSKEESYQRFLSPLVMEARNEPFRGGRGGGHGHGRGGGGGFDRDFSNYGAQRRTFDRHSGTGRDFSTHAPYHVRGNRRHGGFGNCGNSGEEGRPQRTFDRHSGTGRRGGLKRLGAGRGNWGTENDEITQGIDEVFNETEKIVAEEKPAGEEDAPEDKEMTLKEYEKVYKMKRKVLEALKTEGRKVDTKEFESMTPLSCKKENDEIFAKLGSDKDKRKDAFEKEKAKKVLRPISARDRRPVMSVPVR
ncbi:plasminogen activator inhibitor 1 RNA-binding protein-like, partial [Trifolium medium]|nr:plasminogen activator inhibitor 1 RNA-binding protein-like [Trifolium medium]